MEAEHVSVAGQSVPLETDLTTPLAYSLDNPVFKRANGRVQNITIKQTFADSGVYMLQPYDPDKIPVVMVHGFWSNLVTWMEMFNDLQGSPEIRDRYQFWFYLYPTGVPPLLTAGHLRSHLAEARAILDPHHQLPAFDQMVLVGHSMGGLLSRLQVLESGDTFWGLVSDGSFESLKAEDEDRTHLRNAFFFEPNPSIRRIVTIATPFAGSSFSNNATQWLGRKLINIPDDFVASRNRLLKANPSLFDAARLFEQTTSVASLAPDSQLLRAMQDAPMASWVKWHNIVGVLDSNPVVAAVAAESDGVVPLASARAPQANSEITVHADHVRVHRHPLAIKEVERILLEHAAAFLPQRPLTEGAPAMTAY